MTEHLEETNVAEGSMTDDAIVPEYDDEAVDNNEIENETLAEGSIVKGTITKIKPFGALVELPGNIQGLVHISHISSAYVQNVSEYLAVGDIVKVKVLTIDTKANKISLSIKEAETAIERPEPKQWDNSKNLESAATFEEKFKEYVKSSNERLAGLNKRNKKKLN